jgi:hypothetical protein
MVVVVLPALRPLAAPIARFLLIGRLEMLVSKKTDRFVPNNQIDKMIFVDLIQPY